MLTTNTWTENRLVNRSIGIIENILWDISQDLSISMLSVLLICFSEYSGPDFLNYSPKIIPIFPVTCQFEYKGILYTCTQFPLQLVYAITVHKSQGLTLLQVVLNIDQKEHCLGLSYIAILQVKALNRLMFESPFDFSHFTVNNTPTARDRELDISVRKNQIL
jgi:ATP-dependent exoDNAse (exonuclease V) alpha subunit